MFMRTLNGNGMYCQPYAAPCPTSDYEHVAHYPLHIFPPDSVSLVLSEPEAEMAQESGQLALHPVFMQKPSPCCSHHDRPGVLLTGADTPCFCATSAIILLTLEQAFDMADLH